MKKFPNLKVVVLGETPNLDLLTLGDRPEPTPEEKPTHSLTTEEWLRLNPEWAPKRSWALF